MIEHASGLLQTWLGGLDVARFRLQHLGRRPLSFAGTTTDTVRSYRWDRLHALLAGRASMWVVAQGQLTTDPEPHDARELTALFARGVGIVVKEPERHDAQFAELSRAFARDLPGEQRVLVFATPAQTHGFAWHYDAEDVFVLQVAGDKQYFFRRNTIDPHPTRGTQPDFSGSPNTRVGVNLERHARV